MGRILPQIDRDETDRADDRQNNKKYDNQISSSQYVNIVLDTGLEDRFESIMTKNEPFENNEYINISRSFLSIMTKIG